jgi:hypothetical protein
MDKYIYTLLKAKEDGEKTAHMGKLHQKIQISPCLEDVVEPPKEVLKHMNLNFRI